MKKEISKIWGLGLAIVLAATLLFSAAPVSAGELDWGTFTPFPSTTGNVLTTNLSIGDLAVANDGIMYLVTGTTNQTYKSTNAGKTWSKLAEQFSANLTFVAVAPENSSVVAVGYSTNVSISTNGGSSWGDLGQPFATSSNMSVMYDLQVSNADGSTYYVGVAGQNDAGDADVWWFDSGASAPTWHSTKGASGYLSGAAAGLALAFSPNVASDKVMVAVTADTSNVYFQIYSLSTKKWNIPAGFSDYPVNIQNDSDNITDAAGATIALSPDYLGSDDSLRVGFVGISTTSSTDGGIYRLKDTTDKMITDDKNIWSIAFDGSNLVAGASDSNKVYRSDNPLASEPDFSTTTTLKRPGGENYVTVAWKGSEVVAGTSGNMSAFSVSRNNGSSFNGVSFIRTIGGTLGTMQDVDVSADGKQFYLSANDSQGLSLWRYKASWERVFNKIGAADKYIVRLAPENADAVYLAMAGTSTSTDIYYSQDAGDTKWFVRSAKYAIGDMAVESADVAYAAVQGGNTVSKTTNSGFTWATAKDTGITGSINMIRSLGKDKVIAATSSGYVGYSADGNTSWDGINTSLSAAGATQVTASGLATNDYVYAATDAAGTKIERWQIGQSGTSWKDLSAPTSSALYGAAKVFGIALKDGVLYAQATGSGNATALGTGTMTFRSISPTTADPSSGDWAKMAKASVGANVTPQSLKVSAGSTILWSVDTVAPKLYVYTDTLGAAGPTLSSPADGTAVAMNTVSGKANAVALTWARPSKATIYDIKIAQDSGFPNVVKSITTGSPTDNPAAVVVGPDTDYSVALSPGTTYYWRVRVNIAGPVKSPWSATRTFTIGTLPTPQPPVIIQQPPAPVINVPPAPAITLVPPAIVLPTPPPAMTITIPPAPAPPAPITPAYIWSIIIIGAILVIAVIVLIVRTRRPV